MTIDIKSVDEIEKMRVAGRLAADVLNMITPQVESGITTDELNTICHNYIVGVQDATPAPLNYKHFPKSFVPVLITWCAMGFLLIKNLKKGILLISISP
jgi:methionyl aminopeptidase